MMTRMFALVVAVALVLLTAAVAADAGGQAQRFTLTGNTIRGVDQPMHVTATGPISGSGAAADRDNSDGKTGTLTFDLPKGTVVLTNRATSVVAHPNPKACLAKIVEHGTFAVVRGTGAYHGVHGRGIYVRNTTIIGARTANGVCLTRSRQPAAIRNIVTLTGIAALA